MKYSEFVKLDTQLRGQLARDNPKSYFICEAVVFAASMALFLTITDATPWSLWQERPLGRLVFILAWSLAMAWWELMRIRQADAPERANGDLSTTRFPGDPQGLGSPTRCRFPSGSSRDLPDFQP